MLSSLFLRHMNKPLAVCLTLHRFQIGGCELQLINLCKSLQEFPIDLIILHSSIDSTLPPPKGDRIQSFKIPEFFYRYRLIPLYLRWLFRWKLKRTPSLFHCHAICYYTEQVLWYAQNNKIPALVKITTEGHMDSLKEQIRSRLSLLRLIPAMLKRKPWREKRFFLEKTLFGKRRFESYSNVSGYLSISPNISLELERFPIERNKIVPIHNGVDVHRFRPVSENEKKRLKANIGVSEETHLITLAARFADRKRFPDLIQAWSFLASRFPRHLLLLAGDGPERSPCERLAVQLGLESRIRFLGFRYPMEEILQASDLFAFPSEREGLPNAVLEAMSCQLPIVASAIGGIKEMIEPMESGLLFPPKNIEALTQALLYMLEHPEEARRMGVKAREEILRKYSFEITAPKYFDAYLKIAETVKERSQRGPADGL